MIYHVNNTFKAETCQLCESVSKTKCDIRKVMFEILVSNRYLFAKQIHVCNLDGDKEAAGHHFHYILHFQTCKIWFVQTEGSV